MSAKVNQKNLIVCTVILTFLMVILLFISTNGVYAKAENNTVTYMAKHGESSFVQYATTSLSEGQTLSNPSKAWFKVAQWYTDQALTQVAPSSMGNTDLTLYGEAQLTIGHGDVNGNGIVESGDIVCYRKSIVGGYNIQYVSSGSEWATFVSASCNPTADYFIASAADIDNNDGFDIRDVAVVRMAMVGGYGVYFRDGAVMENDNKYFAYVGDSQYGIEMSLHGASTTEYKTTVKLDAPTTIRIKKNGIQEGNYKTLNGYNYTDGGEATHTFLAGTYDVYYETAAINNGIWIDATTASISASYNGSNFSVGGITTVNKANVTVTATRSNGSTYSVTTESFSVNEVDISSEGLKSVGVTYNGLTTNIEVMVINPAGGYNGYTLLGIGGDWTYGIALEDHNATEKKALKVGFNGTDSIKIYHAGTYAAFNKSDSAVMASVDTYGNLIYPAGCLDLYVNISNYNIYAAYANVNVHFYDNVSWYPNLIHAWYNNGTSDIAVTGNWGSTAMNSEGSDWYVATISSKATNIIISQSNDSSEQLRITKNGISIQGDIWVKNGNIYTSRAAADAG